MLEKRIIKLLVLFFWIFTLLWSFWGIYKLYKSPYLPVQIISKKDKIFLKENKDLSEELEIISLNGEKFYSQREIINFIESQKIGSWIKFQVNKNGKVEEVSYKISSLKNLSDS